MIVTHEQTRTDVEINANLAGLTRGFQIFSGLLHERIDEPPRLPNDEEEDEVEGEEEGEEEDESEEDEPDEGEDEEDLLKKLRLSSNTKCHSG